MDQVYVGYMKIAAWIFFFIGMFLAIKISKRKKLIQIEEEKGDEDEKREDNLV